MIKAILFDFDGVIADSEEAHKAAFNSVFADYCLEMDNEWYKDKFGIGAKPLISEYLEKNDISMDDAELDKRVMEKNDAVNRNLIRLFPGVVEILESLKGYKIAVASGGQKVVISEVLRNRGIDKYFSGVFTANDVERLKPFPDVFLLAAEKLDVRPEECIVIEDSTTGIIAAKAAGMKVIGVLTGPYTKEALEKEGVDIVVGNLTEADKILKFIIVN